MQLKSIRYFILSFIFLLVSQLLLAQSQDIDLTGNGTPIIAGSTTPNAGDDTDFGNMGLGSNVIHTFTINNTGGDPLTINTLVISGANAGDFTVSAITPTGTISANGSATFTVTFAPMASGVRNAIVTVNNNDLDESVYDFAITGSSKLQEIKLSGNSNTISAGNTTISTSDDTDFGTVALGGSNVHTFTISNEGTDPLLVTGITVTGANTGDFTVSGIGLPTTLVATTGTITFMVTFTPIASGIRNATITINNDDWDESLYDFKVEGNSPPNACFPTINS